MELFAFIDTVLLSVLAGITIATKFPPKVELTEVKDGPFEPDLYGFWAVFLKEGYTYPDSMLKAVVQGTYYDVSAWASLNIRRNSSATVSKIKLGYLGEELVTASEDKDGLCRLLERRIADRKTELADLESRTQAKCGRD